MTVKPINIERNPDGSWCHPEYPDWSRATCDREIHRWFTSRNLMYCVRYFLDECSDAETAEFDSKGAVKFDQWRPVPPCSGAFLVCISDSDDGPAATWAVQSEQLSPCHVQ